MFRNTLHLVFLATALSSPPVAAQTLGQTASQPVAGSTTPPPKLLPAGLEPKDWVALGSAIGGASIISIGWFVTGWLNRRKDVAQKRLEYRLKTLESFLPVWFIIQSHSAPFSNPNFLKKLEESRSNFQLYGLRDEIDLFEEFINAIVTTNVAGANQVLSKLVPLVRERLREELQVDA